MVVSGDGPSLLGRNWLQGVQLDWKEIRQISTNLQKLLEKYSVLFRKELGTMAGIEVKLKVQPGAVPKFYGAQCCSYHMHLKKQLKNYLEKLQVIEKENYSEWATPVVPVPKLDGTVRLCGDFKVTINPAVLQVDKHPIPKSEDLLIVLAGGSWRYKIFKD